MGANLANRTKSAQKGRKGPNALYRTIHHIRVNLDNGGAFGHRGRNGQTGNS